MQAAIVVNAGPDTTMWRRAVRLFGDRPATRLLSGRSPHLSRDLARLNPEVVYLIDVGRSCPVVLRHVASRACRLVLEVGDWNGPLLARQGRPIQALAGSLLERRAIGRAHAVVVRGRYMLPLVGKPRAHWIPDGVDPAAFRFDAGARPAVRHRLSIPQSAFVVGMIGNLSWSPSHHRVYGEEVVRIVARVPGAYGLIAGGGSGAARLVALAEGLGVRERLAFPGRVAHADVPGVLSAMDAVTSHQTNDAVGWSRTTAKLPEYLANGRVLILSRVGEAVEIPESICAYAEPRTGAEWAAPFVQAAQAVRQRLGTMAEVALREGPRLAGERYGYEVLRPRVLALLESVGA